MMELYKEGVHGEGLYYHDTYWTGEPLSSNTTGDVLACTVVETVKNIKIRPRS